jgi:alkylhydroperoxidase family enzyme
VNELHDTARGGEALWQELRAGWSEAQLIELIALVGFYRLISFTTNALRIPLEPCGARFPAR